jgi:ADP-ribosylglycohydrolase
MIYPTPRRFRQLLRDELTQRAQEGCPVDDLRDRVEAAPDDPAALVELYHTLCDRRPAPDFPHDEPSDLAEVHATLPTAAPDQPPTFDTALQDRLHGAWLGRCAGVMLGKPFECPPFGDDWTSLKRYLQTTGDWPLSGYAPFDAAACRAVGREDLNFPACHRGKISAVIGDDDIHYTIMGLEILETAGDRFTHVDVARWWMRRLVPATVFTAEEAAYRNLIQLGLHREPEQAAAAEWDQVRTWLNPYREWIGAQIRADGWAYACPGQPRRAAEFAYRDASLSHAKNGLYGEMCIAAMIAAAATATDIDAIIHAGLNQIPPTSRLAQALRDTIAFCDTLNRDADRFEDAVTWLWQHLGHYHVVHTINNAAVVAAALLLGWPDFHRVITIAVMAGWDTDCNGGTAGSICGMALGAAQLPTAWTGPLNDTLRVDVPGYCPASITDCATRHFNLAQQLAASP